MSLTLQNTQDTVFQFLSSGNKTEKTLDEERLSLYRNLIMGTVDEVLTSIYPYTKLVFQENWDEVVLNFFQTYPPVHYRVFQLAEPFLKYLEPSNAQLTQSFLASVPFVQSLALYEWREVDIANRPNTQHHLGAIDIQQLSLEKLLSATLVWNPVLSIDTYDFNVPAIIELLKKKMPVDIERLQVETTVVQFREQDTHAVRFFILNPFTQFVMDNSMQKSVPLHQVMNHVKQAFSLENQSEITLLQQALPWLQQCYNAGLLLGCSTS